MSADIKLQAGQWYRTRGGEIVYCVGMRTFDADFPVLVADGPELNNLKKYTIRGTYWARDITDDRDIIEHLPDCTGFDWEPPKPIEPPEGWRLLTEGESISIDDLLFCGGKWKNFTFSDAVCCGTPWSKEKAPVARKIEPPKPKCRPFTATEFREFRNDWFSCKGESACSVAGYTPIGVTLCNDNFYTWQEFFEGFVFDDGTNRPAGALE